MFGPVRAVIVDDVPSDLLNISSGFSAAGIPCTSHWYDRSEITPRKKLKPEPPEGGYEYLRVIFTDLNLDEVHGQLAETIGPVITVISQLVSKNGGPYAVVFWTAMKYPIEDIRAGLAERLEASGIPIPIAIGEITKGPFLTVPSEMHKGEEVLNALFTETYRKAPSLKDEVLNVLKQYDLLHMVSEWESRAIHAAGKSTNNLFSAARLGTTDKDDITDTLKKVSAIVAKEAVGQVSAKAQPAKAYDAAMQDILADSFNQSVNNGDYSEIVKTVLGDLVSDQIEINNSEMVYAHLNTMFHIDANVEGVGAANRGAVIEFVEANKNGIMLDVNSFCCWDDFFWKPQKRNIEVEYPEISDELKGLLAEEITGINKNAVCFANQAVNKLKTNWSNKRNEKFKALMDSKNQFTESLKWVLIEVGAECDHAQGKSRTLRYLIAAETPAKYVRDYVRGGKKDRLRNDALKILGPYQIDGELFYLLISLKRFVAWQLPSNPPDIKVLYRLRKIIVDFLLSNYARWSMRPGITEYKP